VSKRNVAAGVAAIGVLSVSAAHAAVAKAPPLWKNCSHVNAKYRHGVGRASAHDKTNGSPVTTFVRSNRLYALAMKYNRGLDRDKDGIACEHS
jgi:hypothetical protein